MSGDGDAILKLLVSYGDKLDWASLGCFAERNMWIVAKACTNARFHSYMPEEGALLPVLNLLGHQLEKISVDLMAQDCDVYEFKVAPICDSSSY